MTEEVQYLVKISADTAYMSVIGKASYLNCMHAGEFFDLVIKKKCPYLRVDFSACTGMDSTFMGMLAGVTLRLSAPDINGSVTLYNIRGRNLELIENLGLDNILSISPTGDFDNASFAEALCEAVAPKSAILDAHKSLVSAHSANAQKFEDVINFLQTEIGKKEG